MPAGRPSKFTPEVADRIVEAVGLGASCEAAARAGGVHRMTFRRWLAKGRAATRGKFCDFCARIEAAEDRTSIDYLAAIDRSVLETTTIENTTIRQLPNGDERREIARETRPPNTKAAMWWLERRLKDFERRVQTKLSGTGADARVFTAHSPVRAARPPLRSPPPSLWFRRSPVGA